MLGGLGEEALEQIFRLIEGIFGCENAGEIIVEKKSMSESEQTVESLGSSISEIVGRIFNLELMHCQKTLGLEYFTLDDVQSFF